MLYDTIWIFLDYLPDETRMAHACQLLELSFVELIQPTVELHYKQRQQKTSHYVSGVSQLLQGTRILLQVL